MTFKPGRSKHAQENIFTCNIKKLPHRSLVFSNNNVNQAFSQKYLGVTLDVKLSFHEYLNNLLNKVNKTIEPFTQISKLITEVNISYHI